MDTINKCDFIENIKGKIPCKIGRPVDKQRDQGGKHGDNHRIL